MQAASASGEAELCITVEPGRRGRKPEAPLRVLYAIMAAAGVRRINARRLLEPHFSMSATMLLLKEMLDEELEWAPQQALDTVVDVLCALDDFCNSPSHAALATYANAVEDAADHLESKLSLLRTLEECPRSPAELLWGFMIDERISGIVFPANWLTPTADVRFAPRVPLAAVLRLFVSADTDTRKLLAVLARAPFCTQIVSNTGVARVLSSPMQALRAFMAATGVRQVNAQLLLNAPVPPSAQEQLHALMAAHNLQRVDARFWLPAPAARTVVRSGSTLTSRDFSALVKFCSFCEQRR